MRHVLEDLEMKNLASFAMKSGKSEGRIYSEEEHVSRTSFQRDRDRVIHSRAFRRLEYKTQVFVNHEGDYYRTRLTHSLEVAQIARTISRMLRLNEDLAEVISLAHDLGHTPFGHSGQDVLNKLMQDHGGFEHNRQSFRVVTLLEDRYPEFPGLNLTYEVLEGITKHRSEYDLPDGSIFERSGFPSLEAQICNFADEIAYNNHDIDDGLKSGMLELGDLRDVPLWEDHFQLIKKRYPEAPLSQHISQTVRQIINVLVMDLVDQTSRNIQTQGIQTIEDVTAKADRTVGFSPKIREQNAALKKFLYSHLYRHYRVVRMADKAERIITDLFDAYKKNPRILPTSFVASYQDLETKGGKKASMQRIICDYIAGMTDRFALDEYKKLFDPHEKV